MSARAFKPSGRRNLPAGSPIDTLQPEYGTEGHLTQGRREEQPRSGMVSHALRIVFGGVFEVRSDICCNDAVRLLNLPAG